MLTGIQKQYTDKREQIVSQSRSKEFESFSQDIGQVRRRGQDLQEA